MKTVVYVGDSLGKKNSAMNVHAINLARMFYALGYEVVCVSQLGWYPGNNKVIDENISGVRFRCTYSETIPLKNDTVRKMYRVFNQVTGFNHWPNIVKTIKKCNPSFIVLYGYVCSKALIHYSRRKGIPIIIDRTDWFTADHFSDYYNKKIWSGIMYKSIAVWSRKASGIIAISDFFYNYYKDDLPTIHIPALCNIEADSWQKRSKEKYQIAYAGTAGNKDILEPLIKAVTFVNKTYSKNVVLKILGMVKYDKYTLDDINDDNVQYYGKIPHEEVIKVLEQSDCTVLLRRRELYAKAGFSTKFAESMWMGVPVLCTKVGGADLCIEDGVNGYLIDDNEIDTIVKKLIQMIDMSDEEQEAVKRKTYEYAHERFCYRTYLDSMKRFLENVGVV